MGTHCEVCKRLERTRAVSRVGYHQHAEKRLTFKAGGQPGQGQEVGGGWLPL